MTQTVAITGASAGIGRAVARLFAQRGDHIGLIARGDAGLEAPCATWNAKAGPRSPSPRT